MKKKIANLISGILLFFTMVGLPTLVGMYHPSSAYAICTNSLCDFIPGNTPPCDCVLPDGTINYAELRCLKCSSLWTPTVVPTKVVPTLTPTQTQPPCQNLSCSQLNGVDPCVPCTIGPTPTETPTVPCSLSFVVGIPCNTDFATAAFDTWSACQHAVAMLPASEASIAASNACDNNYCNALRDGYAKNCPITSITDVTTPPAHGMTLTATRIIRSTRTAIPTDTETPKPTDTPVPTNTPIPKPTLPPIPSPCPTANISGCQVCESTLEAADSTNLDNLATCLGAVPVSCPETCLVLFQNVPQLVPECILGCLDIGTLACATLIGLQQAQDMLDFYQCSALNHCSGC